MFSAQERRRSDAPRRVRKRYGFMLMMLLFLCKDTIKRVERKGKVIFLFSPERKYQKPKVKDAIMIFFAIFAIVIFHYG